MIVSPTQGIQGELFVSPLSDSEFCPLLLIQCLAEIPELCGFICRSVFPWSSVQVFVNYPIPPRAYIVFQSFPLSVSLLGVIDSVLSHHDHLILSAIQCWWSNVHQKQKFVGSGIPFGNWLMKYPGYRKSPGSSQCNVYQFSLFLKFRSIIWCTVESVVLFGMAELSFNCGNYNMNDRFPIPRFSGIVICLIPNRFWVHTGGGDPMSSKNSWIVRVCLSFGISMIECSDFRKSSCSTQVVYRFSIFSIECFFTGCYRFRFVPS